MLELEWHAGTTNVPRGSDVAELIELSVILRQSTACKLDKTGHTKKNQNQTKDMYRGKY